MSMSRAARSQVLRPVRSAAPAPGRGDDVSAHLGQDAGVELALLVHEGGGQTQETPSAPGHGGAGDKVQLAAGAADLPGAGAL